MLHSWREPPFAAAGVCVDCFLKLVTDVPAPQASQPQLACPREKFSAPMSVAVRRHVRLNLKDASNCLSRRTSESHH